MAKTFTPLHDRILVRRVEEGESVRGGIIILDSDKEKPQQGEATLSARESRTTRVRYFRSTSRLATRSSSVVLRHRDRLMAKSSSSCARKKFSASSSKTARLAGSGFAAFSTGIKPQLKTILGQPNFLIG
jgi:hypothetical protein